VTEDEPIINIAFPPGSEGRDQAYGDLEFRKRSQLKGPTMDSHLDSDSRRSEFLEQLRASSETIHSQGRSKITGGSDGEPVLSRWESCGIGVMQRPADPQGVLRISVGGGEDLPVNVNYCVFRGDREACITLLKRALAAMEIAQPRKEADHE